MADVYTVSQINYYIKSIFNHDYVLNRVCIRGEVSNCRYQNNSGHIYFTLKDENSQISCVMFASKRITGLKMRLEDGMSVNVSGQISVYERDGKYQIYAESITLNGLGNLYEKFEKLKNRLRDEGLFNDEHKKKIPEYVITLGVITAKGGAAIQDIINISTRRNPHIHIILYPAIVQGSESAESLIKGIHAMEKVKPDCIIIGRGGGSIEDLWSFNDENLARAVYNCEIPVISAVGHETDFTVIDFVSDLRAPTPSAAAELAVFDCNRLKSDLVDYHSQLLSITLDRIAADRRKLAVYADRLKVSSPRGRVNIYKERLDNLNDKIRRIMNTGLEQSKTSLIIRLQNLKRLSPLDKLEAGYSYITDDNSRNIKSVSSLQQGMHINIKMADGDAGAVIETVSPEINDKENNNYGGNAEQ